MGKMALNKSHLIVNFKNDYLRKNMIETRCIQNTIPKNL